MLKARVVVSLLSMSLLSIAGHAGELKKVTGLKTPESAVAGPDGRIYVSEIGEFGKEGDGQISVIGSDGKAKPFATGMNDPKGLVFAKGTLYVTDVDRVLKVGKDGKWSVFTAADAFPAHPRFLNDLEADKAGNIYVSDTGNIKENTGEGAIYKIGKDGKPSVVVSAAKDKRVVAPNGLLMDGNDRLLDLDFLTGELYRINLKTGAMEKLAEGFGGGDGVVRASNGMLYLSDWATGRVFSLAKDGTVSLVSANEFKSAADIALAPDGKHLLVPDMKAGEMAYLPIKPR